jgi:hypothetical protein
MNGILRFVFWVEKVEDVSFASITKHQKHPPGTMARLREPEPLPVEARQYKDRIESDSARRPGKQCPNCAGLQFHRHQRRGRWFLPVVEWIVFPICCRLYRWLCLKCGTTFTHLPDLCVPFKRYLRSEIETRAAAYVETEPMSYRKVVKEQGAAVVYDDPIADAAATEAEKEMEAARELAPSTVYRWVGSIAAGREQGRLAAVMRLARQVQPEASLRVLVISAEKYRSRARKGVLETCGLLLRALAVLSRKKPTQLETLGSSP